MGATETQILNLCVGQCHRSPFLTRTAEALICNMSPWTGALWSTPQLWGKLETCSLSLDRAEGNSQAPAFRICPSTGSLGAQRPRKSGA